jgi:sugar lactone lactonase YvrE
MYLQRIVLTLTSLVVFGVCAAQEVTTVHLDSPINADGMAFEADGNLLITSAFDGATIARVNVNSGAVTTAVNGLRGPINVAVDQAGNIYNSNWTGTTVSRTTPGGVTSNFASVEVNGDGLAFDSNGDLWWTNGVNRLIKKISPNGVVTTVASAGLLTYPLGIVLAEDDNFYVSEGRTGEIHRVERNGTVTLFAQVPGNGQWKLGQITAGNGKLYAAGQNTHRVFEIDMDGNVSILAGNGNSINTDGVGESAGLDNPLGATISPDGNRLYVISGTSGTSSLRVIQLNANTFDISPGISGSWYDLAHSGEGFSIEILEGDVALIYWYTFDGLGNPRWFIGVGTIIGNQMIFDELLVATGGIFGPDFDPEAVELESVGTAVFTFFDCATGEIVYVVDGVEGRLDLTRLSAISGLVCID